MESIKAFEFTAYALKGGTSRTPLISGTQYPEYYTYNHEQTVKLLTAHVEHFIEFWKLIENLSRTRRFSDWNNGTRSYPYKRKGVVTLNKSFDFMCSQLRNGRYKLIIERYTEPRTLSQNALMWLWFTCIEQETGTDKQDVHDYYCNLYLRRTTIIKGKETVIAGSTSKLNTLQMTDF